MRFLDSYQDTSATAFHHPIRGRQSSPISDLKHVAAASEVRDTALAPHAVCVEGWERKDGEPLRKAAMPKAVVLTRRL